MYREFARTKIHRVRITETNLYYEGSISLDKKLIQAARLKEGEKVDVLNLSNGNRVQTYVISGDGDGQVILNGPAAKMGRAGQEVIIIAYWFVPEKKVSNMKTLPRVVYVDKKNRVIKIKK